MPNEPAIHTPVIGVDIGGTNMKAVLYDGDKIIADDSLGTPKDNLDHLLVMLKALVDPLLEKAGEMKVKVSGLGLSVAGIIDYGQDKILDSPNLAIINNVKLCEKVAGRLELPCRLDNDGNCFVRAEVLRGAARGRDNVYGIIVSTGIGGGWWVQGGIYRAAHGGSGEPGEMVIDFAEPETRLEAAYHKLMQGNPAQVAEEAYRGDVLAERAYEEVGKFLGISFANIVNLLAPELLVIGGGTLESSALFLGEAKKAMREHIASPVLRKQVRIVQSKLGTNAGAVGAALLFVEHRASSIER
jgi:glucokinase